MTEKWMKLNKQNDQINLFSCALSRTMSTNRCWRATLTTRNPTLSTPKTCLRLINIGHQWASQECTSKRPQTKIYRMRMRMRMRRDWEIRIECILTCSALIMATTIYTLEITKIMGKVGIIIVGIIWKH